MKERERERRRSFPQAAPYLMKHQEKFFLPSFSSFSFRSCFFAMQIFFFYHEKLLPSQVAIHMKFFFSSLQIKIAHIENCYLMDDNVRSRVHFLHKQWKWNTKIIMIMVSRSVCALGFYQWKTLKCLIRVQMSEREGEKEQRELACRHLNLIHPTCISFCTQTIKMRFLFKFFLFPF